MIPHNHASDVAKLSIVLLFLLMPSFTPTSIAPSALAEEAAAPPGKLVKVVMLSRHGVRSPIPSAKELGTWTKSPWPTWYCGEPTNPTVCRQGDLTVRGRQLAEQMGQYYRNSLKELLPANQCPAPQDVFFWADNVERTEDTGLALLRGFHPNCGLTQKTAPAGSPDRIFHPVIAGKCTLDATRAKNEIMTRAGGDLSNVVKTLDLEFKLAQTTLQCCQQELCTTTWSHCSKPLPPPPICTLNSNLPSCLVENQENTQIQTGGALRVASTFAEILLLEYANGFKPNGPEKEQLGWGRISPELLTAVFRVHTTVFSLEQRTHYVAKLQGSMLLRKMGLALNSKSDGETGTAPPEAKFVAYVGHDTNIANIAGMLSLSWLQAGYQENQTPPAGALIFEIRQTDNGARNVYAYYAAQSLDDMHAMTATSATKTPVPIPGCPNGFSCTLDEFTKLVASKIDPNLDPKVDPGCSQ